MRIRRVQVTWLVGCCALFVAMILDIFGLLAVPNLVWLAGSGVLLVIGWRVMPSLKEISSMNRRGGPSS